MTPRGSPSDYDLSVIPCRSWVTIRILFAGALLMLLPGCGGTEECGEGPGIDNALATAERWVRLVAMPQVENEDRTIEVPLRVIPVDSQGSEGPEVAETIAIHGAFFPGIQEGMTNEEYIYLAMASRGLEREMVSFVLIRESNGEHQIVGGECLEAGEQLLRDRLGDDYNSVFEDLIGMTGRERILALLQGPSAE